MFKRHSCSEHITFKCYVSPEEKTISSHDILGSTAVNVAVRAPCSCALTGASVCFAASCARWFSLCWVPSEGRGTCDWVKQSHVTRLASRLGSMEYYDSTEMNEFYMEAQAHTKTVIGDIDAFQLNDSNYNSVFLLVIFGCLNNTTGLSRTVQV